MTRTRIPLIKLPQGLHVGQRVRTNTLYAKVNPHAARGEGTVVGGSIGATGSVWVKLDGHRHPHQLSPVLFEAVE